MDRRSSVLRRLGGRGGTRLDDEVEDQWFIPYKQGLNAAKSGIGSSPTPIKPSGNSLLASVFGTASSYRSPAGDFNRTYQFPRSSPAPNPGPSSHRPFPDQERSIARSPSDSSLMEPNQNPDRLPSSSSVPTGLAGPKMLFSPLSRDLRRKSAQSGPSFYSSAYEEATEPRRQVSLASPRLRTQPYEKRDRSHRWAAASMCDLLVFPRPHLTPHTFSPCASPDNVETATVTSNPYHVVRDGQARTYERDEWSDFVRQRGRSLDFGSRAPPVGAPIIGSAKVRERDHERAASLSRASSRRPPSSRRGSSNRPSFQRGASDKSVKRSFDLANFSRRTSKDPINTAGQANNVGHSAAVFDNEEAHDVRRRAEWVQTRPEHSYSVPTILDSRRPPPVPRTKSVRLQQPLVDRGVIVIDTAEDHEPSKGLPRRNSSIDRRKAPPHLNLSKPLPTIPVDLGISQLSIDVSTPLPADIGVALSSDEPRTAPLTSTIPSDLLASVHSLPSDGGSAHARAFLAKQHQRAKTKRAFATPTQGPAYPMKRSLTPPPGSSTPALLTSVSSATSEQWDWQGRSRSASVGTIEQDVTPMKRLLLNRPRTAAETDSASDVPSRPSSSRRRPVAQPRTPTTPVSPSLPYPITTEGFRRPSWDVPRSEPRKLSLQPPPLNHSASSGLRKLSLQPPPLNHSTSSASKATQYTDASEGWGRSESATPSGPFHGRYDDSPDDSPPPIHLDDADFHGLFFRTPQDTGAAFSGPTIRPSRNLASSLPQPRTDLGTIGLGYGLEEEPGTTPRRMSSGPQSDEDTIEITTPLTSSDADRRSIPHLGFVADMPSSSLQALSSPPRLAGQGVSRTVHVVDSSPGSNPDLDEHDATLLAGASPHSIRYSQVMRGQAELTATPAAQEISGFYRSVHPSVEELPIGSPRPPLSPSLFGATLIPAGGGSWTPQVSSQQGTPASTQGARRHSAVPSFVNDFPSPPPVPSAKMTTKVEHPAPRREEEHASAFGQLVTGPPGAGKTTYCNGLHQFLTALHRPVHIINLDPAVPHPPYPCAINVTDLITLDSVMDEFGLGPNGAILYCVEYLEANFDWLVGELDRVLEGDEGNGYVVFDTPGQAELWTNHDSLRKVMERLMKMNYRLAAVHLSDAHSITDGSKYISVVLLALRAMMQLEMPHVNVFSKIDLLSTYGELPFDLKYYTECRDLEYLLGSLDADPRSGRMLGLNRAVVQLIEEFGMVNFETLAVEDKRSMLHLVRLLDRVTGYIYLPSSAPTDSTNPADTRQAFSSVMGLPEPHWDVDDVQERWGVNKETHDEEEREERERKGEQAGMGAATATNTT